MPFAAHLIFGEVQRLLMSEALLDLAPGRALLWARESVWSATARLTSVVCRGWEEYLLASSGSWLF